MEVNDRGVIATTRDGRRFHAKLVVGADGASSVVAWSLNLMRRVPVAKASITRSGALDAAAPAGA